MNLGWRNHWDFDLWMSAAKIYEIYEANLILCCLDFWLVTQSIFGQSSLIIWPWFDESSILFYQIFLEYNKSRLTVTFEFERNVIHLLHENCSLAPMLLTTMLSGATLAPTRLSHIRYFISVFFQSYFPAMIMVMLGGLTMWIDPKSVPARVSMGKLFNILPKNWFWVSYTFL